MKNLKILKGFPLQNEARVSPIPLKYKNKEAIGAIFTQISSVHARQKIYS